MRKDPIFNNFFDFYIFEEDSAKSIPSDEVFTRRVEESDVYIGLIGNYYGYEYTNGFSATEFEKFNARKFQLLFFC